MRGKNQIRKFWGEIKRGKIFTNYCHRQERLSLGKNIFYSKLKEFKGEAEGQELMSASWDRDSTQGKAGAGPGQG